MPKLKASLLFCLSVLVFIAIISFAFAAESITIDTYYPSPYGTYNMLRLYPRNDIDPDSSCSNAGEMFYHPNDELVYFCNGATWVPGFRGNDLSRRQIYDVPGNYIYTVPPGVTQIKVQVWGGGGGGGGTRFGNGTNGADGSFSTFLTAYGGQAGARPAILPIGPGCTAAPGGAGGGYSSTGSSIGARGQDGQSGDVNGSYSGRGGDAGGSGGVGGAGYPPWPVDGTPPGGGGGGAARADFVQCPDASSSGGGGGGYVEDTFSTSPGTNYAVTVGGGGAGYNSGRGGDGRVIVWY